MQRVGGVLNVVTGATGLLGSHVVEQLVARGERVRAVVRSTSDTTFLDRLGVEHVEGDLGDVESLKRAVDGAGIVYHCAARVGDWGAWRLFQEQIIDATGRLLNACQSVGVGRVLHVSSIIVYGHPKVREDLFTEDEPFGQNPWPWDYYCRAKIEAEALCRSYPGPLTIVRPSWIYGPRDRNTLPRVFKALAARRVVIIGRGDNLLNIIYAADVADGVIRAATHPGAIGRAYNMASEGEVTQRWFIDHLCDTLGLPHIRRRVPFWLAFYGGLLAEAVGKIIRLRRPPHFTRYAVSLIGRSTRYSSARARQELGWTPKVGVVEGLRRTLEWYAGSVGRPVTELLATVR
jgi:nucleoside-diphosphate-sugar epimerase